MQSITKFVRKKKMMKNQKSPGLLEWIQLLVRVKVKIPRF